MDADKQRQSNLEKARQKMQEDFQRQREQIKKENEVKLGAEKFVGHRDDSESKLKRDTIGLMHLDDFKRARENIEHKRQQEVLSTLPKEEVKKRKKEEKKGPKLSFEDETEKEEQNEDGAGLIEKKRPRLGMDPSVNTSFLPDRDREEAERQERERLRQEWLKRQEEIKGETIDITYSYWDGTGHRKVVQCKKGDTIAMFLEKCRQQINELRGVSVDNMMYIKEDLIIPHHYTFYDFVVNKARGKSGPLFSFDVRDDIRVINDASKEKEESHAGKVVERRWYERNKHIFPASRWEVYDPKKDYGSYTIKDKK